MIEEQGTAVTSSKQGPQSAPKLLSQQHTGPANQTRSLFGDFQLSTGEILGSFGCTIPKFLVHAASAPREAKYFFSPRAAARTTDTRFY